MLKQLKIDELMFSIVHSKTEKPSFKYSAEEGELYPLVLEATEKSYLHIVFKVRALLSRFSPPSQPTKLQFA